MSYPFVDQRPLPPLRIHHFLLWTAVSAVMLTVMNAEAPGQSLSSQTGADDIPHTLISSMCLTGLVLGLCWKSRGCPFFDEPGQVAFILHGLWATYGLVSVTFTAYQSNFSASSRGAGAMSGLLGIGALVVGCYSLVLFLRYANRFKHVGKWGRFFKAAGVILALQFLLTFVLSFVLVFSFVRSNSMPYLFFIPALVTFFCGIVEIVFWVLAVREDLREKTAYHWTHWVGASTWPLMRLAGLFSMIMFALDPPDWPAIE